MVRAPAGALSGWTSVATPSAVTAALLSGQHDREPSGVPRWPVPVVAVVTSLAAALTRRLPSSASYPAAVSWGLAGLAANRQARPAVRFTAAAGAAVRVATALANRARGGGGVSTAVEVDARGSPAMAAAEVVRPVRVVAVSTEAGAGTRRGAATGVDLADTDLQSGRCHLILLPPLRR